MSELDDVKKGAKQQVDRLAEGTRRLFVPRGEGMMAVYAAKLEEAIDFLTSDDKTPSNYPLLNAEHCATDVPLENIAQSVIKARAKWTQKMAEIEKIRLSAAKNIRNASTDFEVGNIVKQVELELLQRFQNDEGVTV